MREFFEDRKLISLKATDFMDRKTAQQMNREWNNIIMSFYGPTSIC